MQVIGLTGSAGTGKSTIAEMVRSHYIPCWDADAVVHQLMSVSEELIHDIATLFPEVYQQGVIQRPLLRHIVFTHPPLLQKLEDLIYPHLYPIAQEFIAEQKASHSLCFLDVPLLFEANWQGLCTKVIVTVAPLSVEMVRLQQRGLTEEEIAGILARQWSTERKAALADYSIDTGGSQQQTLQQLIVILGEITSA
ncbi:MAG: dephospho-CoA kinase [Alphaproteobacteria bacterium]